MTVSVGMGTVKPKGINVILLEPGAPNGQGNGEILSPESADARGMELKYNNQWVKQ